MNRKPRYVTLTFAEPLPLFYGPDGKDKSGVGPFYAPGATFHHLIRKNTIAWAKQSADWWRDRGYTVTVSCL